MNDTTAMDLALTTDLMEALDEDYYERTKQLGNSGYSKVKCVDSPQTPQKELRGIERQGHQSLYMEKIKEPGDESKPLESVFNRIHTMYDRLGQHYSSL